MIILLAILLKDFNREKVVSDIEVYSIDEAFLDFSIWGKKHFYTQAMHIRKIIKKRTGIPVSIGISTTKTLAKIANHIAKRSNQFEGVFILDDPIMNNKILEQFPIEKIWGIGIVMPINNGTGNINTIKSLSGSWFSKNIFIFALNFAIKFS